MNERLRSILEASIRAPSGDNCQPWTFHVQANIIEVVNCPERDTSLYNVAQNASWVAHGALLENLLIAASALGLRANFEVFPDPARPQLVARVTLSEAETKNEPLYEMIAQRTTNRRIYLGDPLSAAERRALQDAAEVVTGARLYLAEERQQISRLSAIIRLNDQLVFSNRRLHEFLFSHVRWTDQEASATRNGLDLKTLELNPFDRLGFRLLRYWPLVEKLDTLGVAKIASQAAQKLALSASAIGLITVSVKSRKDLLAGGRAMQRVWLEATRQGLCFQLMTGITFLMHLVCQETNTELSVQQVEAIKAAERELREIFRTEGDSLQILFRIGHGSEPSARSLRLPLEDFLK